MTRAQGKHREFSLNQSVATLKKVFLRERKSLCRPRRTTVLAVEVGGGGGEGYPLLAVGREGLVPRPRSVVPLPPVDRLQDVCPLFFDFSCLLVDLFRFRTNSRSV